MRSCGKSPAPPEPSCRKACLPASSARSAGDAAACTRSRKNVRPSLSECRAAASVRDGRMADVK